MNSKHPRKSAQLRATYGISFQEAETLIAGAPHLAQLDIGWAKIDLGLDKSFKEFVLVTTASDNFSLTAGISSGTPCGRDRSSEQWVSVLKCSPAEVFVGRFPPLAIDLFGFRVVHAGDANRRNFLVVTLPGGDLSFLFRNARSRVAMTWVPAVLEASPIAPRACSHEELTGDPEFDQLLAE